MKNIVTFFAKHRCVYITLITVLALVSFWQYLGFTFWKDDWFLLWGSLNDPRSIHQYWNHPMTFIEFMWLSKLFGTHPLWWQLFGVGLRIGTALALSSFVLALTSSDYVGFLSGLLFAGTVIGMDAVGWPAAHVSLVSAIFLLTGLTFLIRYLKSGKVGFFVVSVLYLTLGFFSDPFRNFPLLLMIPFLPWAIQISNKRKQVFEQTLKTGAYIFAGTALLVFLLFRNEILGSQLFSHILARPSLYWIASKIYVVGNYFTSMANLMFGWLIRFPEDASTGVYNRIVARIGVCVFCLLMGLVYRARKVKSKLVGIIVFSLLWMFVLYIPNWLFEPRLTMGVTHRYMVLSSIGFVLALSYGMTLIRNRFVQAVTITLFIFANMCMAHYYTSVASQYRSASIVSNMWNKINTQISFKRHSVILLYQGDDSVKTYALALSGPAPLGLLRHISNIHDLPIVSTDPSYIQKLLCLDSPVPLNHVYSWYVSHDGLLTNTSLSTRRELLIHATANGCVPMID